METQRQHTHGHGGEGEGEMNGERSREAYTLTQVNRQPVGICRMTQGAQTGLCNNLERREGDSRGRGQSSPVVNSC